MNYPPDANVMEPDPDAELMHARQTARRLAALIFAYERAWDQLIDEAKAIQLGKLAGLSSSLRLGEFVELRGRNPRERLKEYEQSIKEVGRFILALQRRERPKAKGPASEETPTTATKETST